ncbi:putative cysteine-rich receptor-like protein kinase 29-like [Capsicum annuum]|nr:putative cysteine-rich receptor-like protein kinase 29-like [Capsicum annuum]
MGFLKCLIILIFQFCYLFYLNIAQPNFTLQSPCEGNVTEYSPNDAYEANLKTVLFSAARNIDSDGFYNTTIGQDLNKVSLIAQCRGDVELQTCRSCVNNASRLILEKCPYKKSAFGIYDMCLLRYSNVSFIGTMSTYPRFSVYVTRDFSDPQLFFNQYLAPLLTSLRTRASRGGKRKFAADVIEAPDFQTIRALVQCTADLSAQGCYDCLTAVYTSLPGCECYAKWGNYHMLPSCIVRYEPYSFFNESVLNEAPPPLQSPPKPASLPLPPPGHLDALKFPLCVEFEEGSDRKGSIVYNLALHFCQRKDDKTARTIAVIVVPSVTVVIFVVCIPVILMKRRKRKLVNKKESIRRDDTTSSGESLQYDFSTISAATNNFSNANKLGQGGFGPVYKGKLPNGQEVAVKRLAANSGQGELEFKNEVLLVSRIQHKNLVSLLGFCLDGTERLLIYEFVPNASLDHFLFDSVKHRHLDWERRYKIIGGVATGMLYLHEDSRLRIIHRDLKASNILLDAEMNPKISDFGMARLFILDETHGSTSKIAGTYGYMAPEYAMNGKFSVKSDVFSFGVLVLEILSGQRNTCFINGEYVGNLLSYENAADRPTMSAVVLMLSSLSLSLSVPSRPACYMHNDVRKVSTLKGLDQAVMEIREKLTSTGENQRGKSPTIVREREGLNDAPRQFDERSQRGKSTSSYNNHHFQFSRWSRLDFLKFSGEDLRSWLFKVEQFFNMENVPMDERVNVASVQFEGEVVQWHLAFMKYRQYLHPPTWSEYAMALVERLMIPWKK